MANLNAVDRFRVLDQTVKDGLPSFVEGVSAIKKVRDEKLWAIDFASFNEWCQSVKFSEEQAEEWIGLLETIQS